MTADELVAKLKNQDEKARTDAWFRAGEVGAPAIKPLSMVMVESDLEVSRAAKRALWQIARHAGRSDAADQKQAVLAELIGLLNDDQPGVVRREVLWMFSEIGGDESVDPVARLLTSAELREDARMTLQRIPGDKSLAALKAGLAAAPDDFKPNIAQSLRQRGEEVPGIPCAKLVPSRKTNVKPAGG